MPSQSNFAFSATTPAAPSGYRNAVPQIGGNDPALISNYFENIGGVDSRTGTSENITIASLGKMVKFGNSSAIAFTLQNSGLPDNFWCSVLNTGTATATFTPSSGTINGQANVEIVSGAGGVLFFDGTNWWIATGATVSQVQSAAVFDPATKVHFYEEFVGGTNTSGYIGETGWRLNGGGGSIFKSSVSEVDAGSYCGLIQLQSQTGWVYLFFGQDNAQQYIAAATGTFSMKCRVAIVGTSTGQVRIGFFIQDGVQNPSDGVYFEQTNSGNCRAVTRKSSTETSTDTGVALSLNQWATLEIVGVAGTITFKINGNVVATQSTNVPTSFLTWGFECAYVGSVQAYLDIDYAMLDIAISR